ncbi:hypothetical protein L6R52_05205 [Myxococcota bacterium]|nr:hypothetical protein [Myxococcota bacterium]
MHPARSPFDLRRLDRHDLEALCALKLCEEAGVAASESRSAIAAASTPWLTVFLERGAALVAEQPIDASVLARARAFYGPPRLVDTVEQLARVA